MEINSLLGSAPCATTARSLLAAEQSPELNGHGVTRPAPSNYLQPVRINTSLTLGAANSDSQLSPAPDTPSHGHSEVSMTASLDSNEDAREAREAAIEKQLGGIAYSKRQIHGGVKFDATCVDVHGLINRDSGLSVMDAKCDKEYKDERQVFQWIHLPTSNMEWVWVRSSILHDRRFGSPLTDRRKQCYICKTSMSRSKLGEGKMMTMSSRSQYAIAFCVQNIGPTSKMQATRDCHMPGS